MTGSVFVGRPGFVASDVGPAAHFGNPLGEQRALAQGGAVVELGLGVVTVTGPDRLSWLNSITSQLLLGLAPGVGTETLVLDQSGRVEHAARVVDDGTTTWLLTEASDAAPLADWLSSMRFMLRVEVADRSADFVTIGAFADAAPVDGTVVEWVDPWSSVTPGGWGYASLEAHPGSDWTLRIAVLESTAAVALAASDQPAAGLLGYQALRIAAWRPALTDTDERTIPHELDWLRSAVHLSKGCYRGQETVAKVHNLGHPPRRVVMLHLDGSDAVLPEPGTPVSLDGAPVGTLVASAVHHELGPIGLAVVKRSLDPTAVLTLSADDVVVTAAQETIVPPGAGATANVPRLPRLGAVRRN
ncbi:folate-binding protein YgfZ [Curtobacterium sp. MCBA15_001]|uniref:CAF17-like 4Fe-4S cluster assembly/insertion protein YgfZ n=1 Tax=Curtobacterium sp. MCBA15_001 TaxID=1898731 RepID=UPI0008DC757F|nr:folate-binding protein YgfZ [Curtobacterium sp. MCBA15_001]OIH97953.1 aminomethyltransferase [Curtobacterium sp. MCBA15_001]